MRMKSIFLSMLAIAALASCTKQEFIDPLVTPKGEKMVVELTIKSGALGTKVAGGATNAGDNTINDLVVIGVNKTSGAIIDKTYFDGTVDDEENVGNKKVTFETKSQTDAIYVIANAGNLVAKGGALASVSTINALQNVQASLLVPVSHDAAQTEGNVLMSGYTSTVTLAGGSEIEGATAIVPLNFIASKIILKTIQRTSEEGTYGEDYKFVGVMLTNVQTQAYYMADVYPIPTGPGVPSYIGAIDGGAVRDALEKVFMWGAAAGSAGPPVKTPTLYQSLADVTELENGKPLSDIAYWYVFENNSAIGAASTATSLQIHYKWAEKTADKGEQLDKQGKDRYLSITFGNTTAAAPVPTLVPGKAYEVTLKLDLDLRCGDDGGSGPGTDDPENPAITGNVGVSVAPATWGAEEKFEKPL